MIKKGLTNLNPFDIIKMYQRGTKKIKKDKVISMTNKTKKMTKKDYFNELLRIEAVKNNEALVAFIKHELELLENKNKGDKKPTAQQTANEVIKGKILDLLTNSEKAMTITELQKADSELGEMSNQRVSALVRQLIEAGSVVRIEEKRKAYFKAV